MIMNSDGEECKSFDGLMLSPHRHVTLKKLYICAPTVMLPPLEVFLSLPRAQVALTSPGAQVQAVAVGRTRPRPREVLHRPEPDPYSL